MLVFAKGPLSRTENTRDDYERVRRVSDYVIDERSQTIRRAARRNRHPSARGTIAVHARKEQPWCVFTPQGDAYAFPVGVCCARAA